MNWVFREATIAPATRGETARVQEYAELVDSTGAVVYSVNKPYGEDVTAEVNAAQCVTDDTVAIKKETVTLTNAQILTLPTAQVTILAAPGAGKRYLYHGGQVVIHNTAGVYGAVHSGDGTAAKVTIMCGPQVSCPAPIGWILEDGSEDALHELPPRVEASGPGDFEGIIVGFSDYVSEYENMPLRIRGTNGASVNFTGGHADNTMDVTVFYSIADV